MSQIELPLRDQAWLEASVERLYGEFSREAPPPSRVEFYPYSTLRHTLRVREGVLRVRLSDLLADAPADVLESVLAILVCKLLRRRLPRRYRQRYQAYVNSPEVTRRSREMRARRGKKQLTSPRGRIFDLSRLYRRLEQRYFEGQLQVRHLSWSRREARTRLGHYDPAHRAIVINRRLDHPLVPEYVVEFVLYHEMLHAALGDECRNGRRHFHHAEFRQAERRFPDYRRAQRFIETELS